MRGKTPEERRGIKVEKLSPAFVLASRFEPISHQALIEALQSELSRRAD